jgi:predicted RNA-binding Zn-ribbon protein involved in translation (DUF1610 family)
MERRKEVLRAIFLERAAEAFDQAVGWQEEQAEISLTEMEEKVAALQPKVMGLLLESLVALQGTGQEAPGPQCPECGKEMRYKGLKERGLATSVGEIDLERAYYYCPDCGQGFFPPGQRSEGAAGRVE